MKPSDEELLSAYLDGELTVDEQARVQRRLADDAGYRQLHDELRAVRQHLEAIPLQRLPADFSQSVLSAAERQMIAPRRAETDGAAPALPGERRWARPLAWSVLIVAAAVVVMMISPPAQQPANVAHAPAPALPANGAVSSAQSDAKRDENSPSLVVVPDKQLEMRSAEPATDRLSAAPAKSELSKDAGSLRGQDAQFGHANKTSASALRQGRRESPPPADGEQAEANSLKSKQPAAEAPAMPPVATVPTAPAASQPAEPAASRPSDPAASRPSDPTRPLAGHIAPGAPPAAGAPFSAKAAARSAPVESKADQIRSLAKENADRDAGAPSLQDASDEPIQPRQGKGSPRSAFDDSKPAAERSLEKSAAPPANMKFTGSVSAVASQQGSFEQLLTMVRGTPAAERGQQAPANQAAALAESSRTTGVVAEQSTAPPPASAAASPPTDVAALEQAYDVELTYGGMIELLAQMRSRPDLYRLDPLGQKIEQDVRRRADELAAAAKQGQNSDPPELGGQAFGGGEAAPAGAPSSGRDGAAVADAKRPDVDRRADKAMKGIAADKAQSAVKEGERTGRKTKKAQESLPDQAGAEASDAAQSVYRVRIVLRHDAASQVPAAAKQAPAR